MVSGFWPSAILIVLSIFGPPLVLVNANCDHRVQFCLAPTATQTRERNSRNDLYRNWDLSRYEPDQKGDIRLSTESRSADRLRERSTERTTRSIRELPVVREARQREISRSSSSDRQRVEQRIESATAGGETQRVRRENVITRDDRRNSRIDQRQNREDSARFGTEDIRRVEREPKREAKRVTREDRQFRDSDYLNENQLRLGERRVRGQLREKRDERRSLRIDQRQNREESARFGTEDIHRVKREAIRVTREDRQLKDSDSLNENQLRLGERRVREQLRERRDERRSLRIDQRQNREGSARVATEDIHRVKREAIRVTREDRQLKDSDSLNENQLRLGERRVREQLRERRDERRSLRIDQRQNREGSARFGTEDNRRVKREAIRVTREGRQLRDSDSLNENQLRLSERRVRGQLSERRDERRSLRSDQRENREASSRFDTENVRRVKREAIHVTRDDRQLRDSDSLTENRLRLGERRDRGQLKEGTIQTIRRENRASLPLAREERQTEIINEHRVREDSPRENDQSQSRRVNRNNSDRKTRDSSNIYSPRRLIRVEQHSRLPDVLRSSRRNERREIVTHSSAERRDRLLSIHRFVYSERKVRDESERRQEDRLLTRRVVAEPDERQREISERRIDDANILQENSRRRVYRSSQPESHRLNVNRLQTIDERYRKESSTTERRHRNERLQHNNQEERIELEERYRTVSTRDNERRNANERDSQDRHERINFPTDIVRRTERLNGGHTRNDLRRGSADRLDSRIEFHQKIYTPEARSIDRREIERESGDRQVTRINESRLRSSEKTSSNIRNIKSRLIDLTRKTSLNERHENEQRRENGKRRENEQRRESDRRRGERVERAERSTKRRDIAEIRNSRTESERSTIRDSTDRWHNARNINTERISSKREIARAVDQRREISVVGRESVWRDTRQEHEGRRTLKMMRNDRRETRMDTKLGENAFEELQFRKAVSSKYLSGNAYDDSAKNQYMCHIMQAVLIGTIALKLFFQREINEKKTCSQWSGFGKFVAVTKHLNLL